VAGLGQNGRGVELGEPAMDSTGPFSHLARLQYLALLTMRSRMVANSVRSLQGAFELGARSVAFMIYTFMGLALGFGLGAGAYSMLNAGHEQFLPALFWTVFAVWQVLPIALASFQEQFDLSGLLRFPVSFGSFYLLNVAFGLVDVPALLGGICCLGLLGGVTLARPGLFGWTLLVLAVYALFNILLARTVLAWLDRWLAKRRTREIVSALFLLMMLSLQLLNPALHQNTRLRIQGPSNEAARANHQKMITEVKPWASSVNAVQKWLPPGLAGNGLARAAGMQGKAAMGSLGVLGIYILATGGILSIRLRAEFRGERLSEAPAARKKTTSDSKWLIDGSGPIAAVMEKELRTIPRSMPLLFAMGAPLLTVLVISTLLRNTASGSKPFELAFPLCVCYALLGFTQMIFNNLGAEGTGIQLLFLSPTPIRKVLLAKNMIHGFLFLIVASLAGIFAALRLGTPDLLLVVTTAAWLLFALPANLAAGNLLSITMPYRVNLGRLSRQRGSQASALISMLVQVLVMACGVAVFELCTYFNEKWLAAPCLLILAGVAFVAWTRVLAHADVLANRNRENLIAKLAKTE
jgi:ABC-2 type transport system permease protein